MAFPYTKSFPSATCNLLCRHSNDRIIIQVLMNYRMEEWATQPMLPNGRRIRVASTVIWKGWEKKKHLFLLYAREVDEHMVSPSQSTLFRNFFFVEVCKYEHGYCVLRWFSICKSTGWYRIVVLYFCSKILGLITPIKTSYEKLTLFDEFGVVYWHSWDMRSISLPVIKIYGLIE